MEKMKNPWLNPAKVASHLLLAVCLLYGTHARAATQEEWEKTVAAAEKEGRVNVYMWGDVATLDAGVFQKAYPGIKLYGVTGRRGILHRVIAERRAGKYIPDVSINGASTNYRFFYRKGFLVPIKPVLVLPEVLDESKWWQGKHRYVDQERRYVFVNLGSASQGGFHYNTNLVDPKEFKSFWDFLNPKWKGKIEAQDLRGNPGRARAPLTFLYHHPDLGPKFLRRLFSEMDITLFRNERFGTDWLVVGKFSICFACNTRPARLQGLAVDSFGRMKEGQGLSPGGGTVALMNRAPHPNAAKVFINWFLSREGQKTYQSAGQVPGDSGRNSLREDIPKEVI